MNRKTWFIIIVISLIMICSVAIISRGVYSIWNNPTIRESIETGKQEFGAMIELREKILSTFPCQDAGVELMNGNSLKITLVNSEYNSLTYAEQNEKAKEIAFFVKNSYSGNAVIESIVIIFSENAQVGPINTTSSYNFIFDVSELE